MKYFMSFVSLLPRRIALSAESSCSSTLSVTPPAERTAGVKAFARRVIERRRSQGRAMGVSASGALQVRTEYGLRDVLSDEVSVRPLARG